MVTHFFVKCNIINYYFFSYYMIIVKNWIWRVEVMYAYLLKNIRKYFWGWEYILFPIFAVSICFLEMLFDLSFISNNKKLLVGVLIVNFFFLNCIFQWFKKVNKWNSILSLGWFCCCYSCYFWHKRSSNLEKTKFISLKNYQ